MHTLVGSMTIQYTCFWLPRHLSPVSRVTVPLRPITARSMASFLGCSITDLSVRCYDVIPGCIKTACNVLIEEVHCIWTRLIWICHLRRRHRLVV
jgi:hypothetical protein